MEDGSSTPMSFVDHSLPASLGPGLVYAGTTEEDLVYVLLPRPVGAPSVTALPGPY